MWCRVDGEATALAADAVSQKLAKELRTALGDGYGGYTRMVCKSAWDYKAFHVFKTPDDFGLFMEADSPGMLAFQSAASELQAIAVDDVEQQNFVYDEVKL